jgi:hypothetical protein
MNNTASIAQFLAVLGGSANPALLGQKSASASTDFRSLFMTQFGGVAPASESVVSEDVSTNTKSGSMNLWQLMNQNVSGEPLQNSLVLQLQQTGLAPDVIDQLVGALDQSDLVTIIKDPKLVEQLKMMAETDNAQAIQDMNIPTLSDIIESLQTAKGSDGDLIFVNIAEMNLEEFKEWKKQNFSDLAAFLNSPKTKINANGDIVKILQGPAFLQEDGADHFEQIIIDIAAPQAAMTPVELALQFASQPPAMAQQAIMTGAPLSFVPVPLSNIGNVPPTLQQPLDKDGLIGKIKDGALKPSIAGISAAQQKSVIGEVSSSPSGVQSQAKNTTAFTPMMTAADMNALNTGGDGFDSFNSLIPFEAGFKTAAQSANPLTSQPAASQPHPTTQMVAMSLTKMASGKGGETDSQRYRLQLDPPEMGRVDIELEFEVGQKIRATIVAEKPETLGLLQRDSHALLKALQEAGFDSVSQDNLNFDLSQGQNDSADHRDGDRQNGQNALLSPDGESELQILETEMAVIIDPVTGLKHVNMVV